MFTGGDVLEIGYNHPVIGSGKLFVKADEDATIHRGGYMSEEDRSAITGDGQFIDSMKRQRPRYESGPVAWDMTDVDEQDKLIKLQESPVLADWTIQHISGAIFAGKGKPVGELPGNLKAATLGLNLEFEGRLEKIS